MAFSTLANALVRADCAASTDSSVTDGVAESVPLRAKNAVAIATGALDWNDASTFGSGILDRSPCGTGTCAVMAHLHARGELKVGEEFVHESILGTTFHGTLLEETTLKAAPGREGVAVLSRF